MWPRTFKAIINFLKLHKEEQVKIIPFVVRDRLDDPLFNNTDVVN